MLVNSTTVSISVVMPTYQDSAAAVRTAQALRPQLTAADELLIVDNGSDVHHREVCEAFAREEASTGMRVLFCSARGSYAARNLGAAHAIGDILAFTDAGCVPCAGWLNAIRSHFASRPTTRVAGPVEMTYAHATPSLVELMDARIHLNQDRYVTQGWAATANMAMPRDTLLALGGFDQRLQSGGDYEFGIRAMAQGCGIDWCSAMQVQHEARHTLRDLMKKRRRILGGTAQISAMAEFPELVRRASRAACERKLVTEPRIYPPMGVLRWQLARIAGRLLHEYERITTRIP